MGSYCGDVVTLMGLPMSFSPIFAGRPKAQLPFVGVVIEDADVAGPVVMQAASWAIAYATTTHAQKTRKVCVRSKTR
jgi:hypothetical protein